MEEKMLTEEIFEQEKEEAVNWKEVCKRLALKLFFVKAGCSDEEYLCYRFYSKAEFDEMGALTNGDAILNEAKESCGEFFKKPVIEGIRPAEKGKAPGLSKQDFAAMNYGQRAELYERDPASYEMLCGR